MSLDFDKTYAVSTHPGIAFRLDGYVQKQIEPGEWAHYGTESEALEAYNDMLDECYDPIKIGELEYGMSCWKSIDEIAYHTGFCDWLDSVSRDEEPEFEDDETRVHAHMVGDDRDHIIDVDDLTPLDDDDYCPGCGQIGCACYGSSE